MSDFREEHMGAVYAAKQGMGELQGVIANLTALHEGNLGLIASATGGMACRSEAGRNAFEFAAALNEQIGNLFRSTEIIVGELDRYANGF